jgi:hypothetical protein
MEWSGTEYNGVEWNGAEWNIYSIPLFGYLMMRLDVVFIPLFGK